MKPIIEVKRVGKQYKKGIDRRYKSLRDSLGRLSDLWTGGDKETFWALQDISFNVERGESLGIIGRNGAGKSTLLKILARITPPTTGEIIMRGRVASLLEVGTGFHPELTGRENIFFNGSILGMRYHEIKKKFDEIVNFSGVETFLDTPLKHYSSGMQMRLAFSVAAHLEAEILLIDEVLAVGDAEFQKKCIGKMDEVSRGEGKTILLVSHDTDALVNLNHRGIVLEKGSLHFNNLIKKAVNEYLDLLSSYNKNALDNIPRSGNGKLRIIKIQILSTSEYDTSFIKPFNDVKFIVSFQLNTTESINELKIDIGINNAYGRRVAWMTSKKKLQHILDVIDVEFIVEKIPLVPNEYNLNIYCEIDGEVTDWIKNIGFFKIVSEYYFDSNLRIPQGQGDLLLKYQVL